MEECEVKFLDIDPETMVRTIEEAGGQRQFDRVFKRIIFDYPDLRLNDENAWLRLRDEGDKVTLTFKQRQGVTSQDASSNDGSMLEHEVVVSDFEKTADILRSIGMKEKFYEENRRVRYLVGEASVDIDYWPMIKPYVEIEGPDWETVDKTIAKLGLNPADKKVFSTMQVYKLNGIDEMDYAIITFEKQVKRAQRR